MVVTPISPSGSFSAPHPVAPLATPAPSAVPMPLATQPGISGPLAAALGLPTNAPTAAMAQAYPHEDPLVGKTLVGRYQIAKKLGEGGMGTVYLATHVLLEKQVALKVLHGEYARKPDLVERFMQEARAASRINHENVIDISDFGVTEDGYVFFAMELLKGKDLHDLIARARLEGQILPWDRSRHIFLQICAALAIAHTHKIVHRDLKPENIYLIEFLGRPDFVKLLDFGIAKLGEGEAGERKLTRTGMLFGTPEYMSPEQARGEAKIDHRVDIYAMACILFQLLTGRVPFEAENFMGVLSLHLTEPPPEIPPATLERCGAPPEIAAIVAKGLAKKPADRWQTIEEMADAIRALHGEPLEEAPAPAQAAPAQAAPTQPPRSRTEWTGKLEIPGADAPAAAAAAARSKVPLLIGGVLLAAAAIVAVVLATRGPTPVTTEIAESGGPAIVAPTPTPGGGGLATAPTDPPVSPPIERTVEPAPIEPPAAPPIPDSVTITFNVAKKAVLLDHSGKQVAKGGSEGITYKVVVPGSSTAVVYLVRGGRGTKDTTLSVVPDADVTVDAIPDLKSSRSGGGNASVAAGAPEGGEGAVVSPGGGKVGGEKPPKPDGEKPSKPDGDDKPGKGDDNPVDDDGLPNLKPFESPAKAPAAEKPEKQDKPESPEPRKTE